MKKSRDYQINAATSLWNHVHSKFDRKPLVVLPTGSGKSHTMALFMSGMITAYPHVRMISTVHVKELVKNNYEALMEIMPHAPAGIYSSGLGRRDVAQVTFTGIDSVVNRALLFGHIDFLLVDEAHRISDKETASYNKFIDGLRRINPKLIVIGFTATDWRMGTGKLTESGIFDDVCYDMSSGEAFLWMIDQGYLLKPVPKKTQHQADADDIGIKMGEFDAKEAAAEFDRIIEPAIDEIILAGQNRQAWLLFAQNIEQAEIIADMMNHKGYPFAAVHSKGGDRDGDVAKFLRGEYRGLVNKDILTTGFDDPRIDLIGMLRMTNSPGLWVQMLGRGTRPLWAKGDYDITTREGRLASIAASAKQNCLVLDFAANTTRLGPINYPNVPRKRKGQKGDPPVRECPQCGSYIHISIKVCDTVHDDGTVCGYVFPEKPKLRSTAAETDLVIDMTKPVEKEYKIYGVGQMIASRHQTKDPNKKPSMKVDYYSGGSRFTAWLAPESPFPFAVKKAREWWGWHAPGIPMPTTADEMVKQFNELRKPKFIKVWTNTKYPEIVDYDFRGTRFELPPELGGPPLQEPIEAAIFDEATAKAKAQSDRIQAIMAELGEYDVPF